METKQLSRSDEAWAVLHKINTAIRWKHAGNDKPLEPTPVTQGLLCEQRDRWGGRDFASCLVKAKIRIVAKWYAWTLRTFRPFSYKRPEKACPEQICWKAPTPFSVTSTANTTGNWMTKTTTSPKIQANCDMYVEILSGFESTIIALNQAFLACNSNWVHPKPRT